MGWQPPYQQLEYIESTGTQYIDTGIFGLNTRVVGSGRQTEKTSHSSCIIDALDTKGARTFIASQMGANGSKWGIGSSSVSNTPSMTRAHYDINFLSSIYSGNIDGIYVSVAASSASVTNWHIGRATGDAGTIYDFVGEIYSQKFYQNGILVRNFIPAKRNSDKAIGMWDTVSETFFANAGTGVFIAGPEVGPVGPFLGTDF